MMIRVVLDDSLDCKGVYAIEFFLSTIGVSFDFIDSGCDNTCDLLLYYGWQLEEQDWAGRPVISIPSYARMADLPEGIIARRPPIISSFFLLDDEQVPFYYPFLSLSEGEMLYRYKNGGVAVLQEGEVMKFGFDMIASAFYLLNLEGEGGRGNREWGMEKKEADRRDLLQPTVDRYVKLLQNLIERGYHKRNLPFVSVCHWPYGKWFAVFLSHDVDRIYRRELFTLGVDLYRILRNFLRGDFSKAFSGVCQFIRLLFQPGDPYWNFERWMTLEAAYHARSSFYFMEGRRIGRYRRRYNCQRLEGLIRKLHDEGWEIGLHGSYYAWQDSEKLKAERMALEWTLGDRITGHRQHYLRFDPDRSYHVYQEAGFDYDTTLGYNDVVGYRAGTSYPFLPYHDGEGAIRIIEIPLIVMDFALVTQGLSSRTGFLMSLLEKTEADEGCLSLLWHECAYDDYDYPGWDDPGWGEAYEGVLRYVMDHDGWTATGRDIATWWRARCACRYTVDILDKMIVIRLLSPAPEGLSFRVLLPGQGEKTIECRLGEWRVDDVKVVVEEGFLKP